QVPESDDEGRAGARRRGVRSGRRLAFSGRIAARGPRQLLERVLELIELAHAEQRGVVAPDLVEHLGSVAHEVETGRGEAHDLRAPILRIRRAPDVAELLQVVDDLA